jgi:hypothetical protein
LYTGVVLVWIDFIIYDYGWAIIVKIVDKNPPTRKHLKEAYGSGKNLKEAGENLRLVIERWPR